MSSLTTKTKDGLKFALHKIGIEYNIFIESNVN